MTILIDSNLCSLVFADKASSAETGVETLLWETIRLEYQHSNDSTVFWQIWLSYRDYLYRCCLGWMNHNAVQAEEVLDHSMLKAYAKFPQYADKITHMKAWLRQVCYRTCLDFHRKLKRETLSDDIFWQKIQAETDSPMDTVTHQETQTLVNCAVETLPSQLQQPFVLRVYENQSYEAISQQLSISVCNARKRVQLARKKVKQYLGAYLWG